MAGIPTRGTAPHAFVDDLGAPVLTDADHHHLARARRVRPGERLSVSDGRGAWRWARLGDGPALDVDGEIEVVDALQPSLTVALAPVKGQRPDWAVQKLTELGVDEIWLLQAERSVVRWEADPDGGLPDRLVRIVREAAAQSRRVQLPDLRVGVPVAEAAARSGAALAHAGGAPLSLATPVVLVGPEGGWSDAELADAHATVRVAPTVLRAETAAVAVGAVLVALRSGLVAKP